MNALRWSRGHAHGCGCAACCDVEDALIREEECLQAGVEELARRPSFNTICASPEDAEAVAKEEIEWLAEFKRLTLGEAAAVLLRRYK